MFVKRVFYIGVILLMALALPGHAQENIRCWTTKTDVYYHIEKGCGMDEERFPISEAAAIAFEKKPCPDCLAINVSEMTAEEVDIAMRAGTYVVRIPQSMLESCRMNTAVSGNEIQHRLAGEFQHMMPAEQYDLLKAAVQAGKISGDKLRTAGLMVSDDEKELSVRCLEDAWYLIARPRVPYSAENPLRWQVLEYRLEINGETNISTVLTGLMEQEERREVGNWSGGASIFEKDYGGLDICVYRGLDANIAVIHEKNANAILLESRLQIVETDLGIPISGYMSAEDVATYCCVLSDAELGMLVSGRIPKLMHVQPLERAVFDNGAFAPVQLGISGVGLIDHTGVLVTNIFYKAISRCVDSIATTTEPTPWFCTEADGTIHVFNPDDLGEIGSYTGALRAYYENPAIFVLKTENSCRVISLQDGSVMWEIPLNGSFSDASGETFESISIDGKYRYVISGMPECMVITLEGEAGTVAWIAENRGKRKTQDYRRIIPLVWNDDSGIFSYEPLNGSEGKIGLMDHEGNTLTEAVYDAVEVVSPEWFEMINGFEKTVVIVK